MSLQWDNKYTFEAGDVVEVKTPQHPFKGFVGVVRTAFSQEQFGIAFKELDCGENGISLWAADLALVATHRNDA